ncbi:unnamed protein product [Caenorhabditis bovis]|uniref:Innexin n=1 Tax=Caenorhabditis bovis TaxID=2654633 RepID=A0A8S1EJJ2_9PELO|nr:unnamed protein product [Caenorhabditis bovis]
MASSQIFLTAAILLFLLSVIVSPISCETPIIHKPEFSLNIQKACHLEGVHANSPEWLEHGVQYFPHFSTHKGAPLFLLVSAIGYVIPKLFIVIIMKTNAFPLVYICGTAYLIGWKKKEERKVELREIASTLRSRLGSKRLFGRFTSYYFISKLGYLLNCLIQIVALPHFLEVDFISYWSYMLGRPFSFINVDKPPIFPSNGTCWIETTEYLKLSKDVPSEHVMCKLFINAANEFILTVIGYYLVIITILTAIGSIKCFIELQNTVTLTKNVLLAELDPEERPLQTMAAFLESLRYDGYVALYLIGNHNIYIEKELILQLFADFIETHVDTPQLSMSEFAPNAADFERVKDIENDLDELHYKVIEFKYFGNFNFEQTDIFLDLEQLYINTKRSILYFPNLDDVDQEIAIYENAFDYIEALFEDIKSVECDDETMNY